MAGTSRRLDIGGRRLLRHSDVKVTMRYAHLTPDNVRAAVSVLDSPSSRFGHIDRDDIERISA